MVLHVACSVHPAALDIEYPKKTCFSMIQHPGCLWSCVGRVVNLCSGKPDLPVKMFLPLLVKKYFTGKKIWYKKCLFASIFGTFLLEWTGLTFGS